MNTVGCHGEALETTEVYWVDVHRAEIKRCGKKWDGPGVERGSAGINSPGESRAQGLDCRSVVVLGEDFKGRADKSRGGDQMNHQQFQLKPFGYQTTI